VEALGLSYGKTAGMSFPDSGIKKGDRSDSPNSILTWKHA
jgi:hypothetical protein